MATKTGIGVSAGDNNTLAAARVAAASVASGARGACPRACLYLGMLRDATIAMVPLPFVIVFQLQPPTLKRAMFRLRPGTARPFTVVYLLVHTRSATSSLGPRPCAMRRGGGAVRTRARYSRDGARRTSTPPQLSPHASSCATHRVAPPACVCVGGRSQDTADGVLSTPCDCTQGRDAAAEHCHLARRQFTSRTPPGSKTRTRQC